VTAQILTETRDGRPDELEQISVAMLAAYDEYSRLVQEIGGGSDEGVSATEAWEAYWKDVGNVWSRLEDSELIVAERDGRIVGAVTFYAEGRRDESHRWPVEWASIRLLAVVPEMRGVGIGKALVLECLARARRRGAIAVGLHTMDAMWIAQGMYERLGFARVSAYDYRPHPEVLVKAYRLPLAN